MTDNLFYNSIYLVQRVISRPELYDVHLHSLYNIVGRPCFSGVNDLYGFATEYLYLLSRQSLHGRDKNIFVSLVSS